MTYGTNVVDNHQTNNKNIENDKNCIKICDTMMSAKNSQNRICRQCCTTTLLTFGTVFLIVGLLTLKFTLFEMLMEERLNMRPEFPPFKWWKNPEPEVLCKAYIFTVTNPDEFLNETDTKLKIKEFGPIVYREKIKHSDIIFHENSTLSYTISRYVEYAPEYNPPGILNQTIIVPNIGLLGMVAFLADYSFTIKIGFNIISQDDSVFMNTTVYNYLWNLTTPALVKAKQIVSFMVPQDNAGPMNNVYEHFTDRVNVRIGKKYGASQFFQINTYNDRTTVPGFNPEQGDCYASIQNSTEGTVYGGGLTKQSTPYFWRKTVCRTIPLMFEKEMLEGSIKAYKYVALPTIYDRFENLTADCYKGFGDKILPNGISDVSKCYHDLPVTVSLPHFYGRDGYWNDQLEGFTPSKEKHESYTILEPTTGVPMRQRARSQSNLVMPDLTFFNADVQRFSGFVIPMIWMEYTQDTLTPTIDAMLIFVVNILPTLQYIISVIFIICGILSLYFGIKRLKSDEILFVDKNLSPQVSCKTNISLIFEKEQNEKEENT